MASEAEAEVIASDLANPLIQSKLLSNILYAYKNLTQGWPEKTVCNGGAQTRKEAADHALIDEWNY